MSERRVARALAAHRGASNNDMDDTTTARLADTEAGVSAAGASSTAYLEGLVAKWEGSAETHATLWEREGDARANGISDAHYLCADELRQYLRGRR